MFSCKLRYLGLGLVVFELVINWHNHYDFLDGEQGMSKHHLGGVLVLHLDGPDVTVLARDGLNQPQTVVSFLISTPSPTWVSQCLLSTSGPGLGPGTLGPSISSRNPSLSHPDISASW
jgi:hypothetical protein